MSENNDYQNERQIIDPILELIDARPQFDEGGLSSVRYNLRLNPGDCVLIESKDVQQAAKFTDMCLGLVDLTEGQIRCMGLDWADLDEKRQAALRGRVGRIVSNGGWIDLYGTHMNILWPQLYHTKIPEKVLIQRAVKLGIKFGLPGLPVDVPNKLTALDRSRADCVRAFLGNPSLLLLENPMGNASEDLNIAFLEMLTEVRNQGCAVIWLAPDDKGWKNYKKDTTFQLRLMDDGLVSAKKRS
ncbi:P-loop NTPase family protein [Swingsia samuiensis]|uniref:ABC transporter ATP-binding protein n=1 Tax=Swingsia samuiensis TaxID=1293412 RepID=A0A4Y6UMS8_9PROT|nr:ABC transporter ATP-binding protein [Swingsia samuiensis]QDH17691.1 ABC transporter ATP-binding protein [Swingsia samuiensis]